MKRVHKNIKPQVDERLRQFKKNDTKDKIEKEFFFCLLTPQCKARVCWDNVERLSANGILHEGTEKQISENFCGVRFRNNKAGYIVEARSKFFNGKSSFLDMLSEEKDEKVLRKHIADNVKGMGYKEASHFLRNIGKGGELAILDRHILRGLFMAGVIKKIPNAMTASQYIMTEEFMKKFAGEIKIPMPHLDFVFWYFFNKEVFK
ncbi:MAG: N-glycosylase/DNA lyase [Candidatus Omnitrophica bacterium]|nr:N-glycosylase/DNA lyase [Candidatus Omnitrophota bacterium]